MSEEIIKEIFILIAYRALDNRLEIRLEKGKNKSDSNVLGGSFSKSFSEYDSLSLHVYAPGETDAEEDETEEETE